MQIYEYEGIKYSKRKLTDNILLKVITDEYELVRTKSDSYKEKAAIIKQGEETSQLDACPVKVNQELRAVLETLRRTYEGLRARHTQTAPVIYIDDVTNISEDDAKFLIANGSIAVLSRHFTDEAKKELLSHQILPITISEKMSVGEYIFINDILKNINEGQKELKAFIVDKELIPVEANLPLEVYGEKTYSEIWE